MCRNHRGFVEAVVAANRIGADLLLLNTSFAGPALAEVVAREGADAVVYDEEFTETVDRALADKPGRHADRRLDRRPVGARRLAHRREDDRRAQRAKNRNAPRRNPGRSC